MYICVVGQKTSEDASSMTRILSSQRIETLHFGRRLTKSRKLIVCWSISFWRPCSLNQPTCGRRADIFVCVSAINKAFTDGNIAILPLHSPIKCDCSSTEHSQSHLKSSHDRSKTRSVSQIAWKLKVLPSASTRFREPCDSQLIVDFKHCLLFVECFC